MAYDELISGVWPSLLGWLLKVEMLIFSCQTLRENDRTAQEMEMITCKFRWVDALVCSDQQTRQHIISITLSVKKEKNLTNHQTPELSC